MQIRGKDIFIYLYEMKNCLQIFSYLFADFNVAVEDKDWRAVERRHDVGVLLVLHGQVLEALDTASSRCRYLAAAAPAPTLAAKPPGNMQYFFLSLRASLISIFALFSCAIICSLSLGISWGLKED